MHFYRLAYSHLFIGKMVEKPTVADVQQISEGGSDHGFPHDLHYWVG